jgi:hypothetical protein
MSGPGVDARDLHLERGRAGMSYGQQPVQAIAAQIAIGVKES